MKSYLFIALLVFTLNTRAQNFEVVTLPQLQERIVSAEAPLTIFNFWATWCGPCVKEMPYFQEIDQSNADVKVFFVSVDFKEDLAKVKKFIEKRQVNSDVLYLDEKDPDLYMRKISDKWTGAIPATLFVTDLGKTYFQEKAFTKDELNEHVSKYLN